ncbi:hypothetical protein FRC06_003085, partial [Ceratobasidium sp. 370]
MLYTVGRLAKAQAASAKKLKDKARKLGNANLSAVSIEALAPLVGWTGSTTTAGPDVRAGTGTSTGSVGTCTGAGTSTRATRTATKVSKHRDFVASNVSQHSHFVDSLDPTALIARLKKFVKYDLTTIDLETAHAILKEYITDSSPAMVSPKQQVEVDLVSEDPIGVGGGNHMAQMQIDEPSRSAKRPSTPPVAQPSKQPKVTIREIPDEDNPRTESNTDTESESELNDTATESESELEIPTTQLPRNHTKANPNVVDPSFRLSTSQHLTQTWTIPPLAKPPPAQPQPARQPAVASTLSQRPHASSQASSRVHSQGSCDPRRQPVPPTPSAASAKGSHDAHASTSSGARTPHSGMPSTHEKAGKPTVHEREKRARAKATARMLDLKAEPLVCRGIRIKKGFTSKTAKMIAAVREAYNKIFHAAAGGAPMEPEMLGSHGNLDDDLVPDNEEERVAQAAEAAGEELVTRKRKPSSCDIHGYEKQILTTAKMHLFAITLIEGMYQTRTWFMKMARIIFIETWRQELLNVPIQIPSENILQVMVNSLATARGQIKLA